MSELVERLRSVHDRVAQLLRQHRELRAQLDRVGSSERELGQRIAVLETRIAELEKENEVLRSAKAAHEAAVPGAKERIDELVQEIDRCLELIQN